MLDSHQSRPGILINLPGNGVSAHGPMLSLVFGLCGRLSLSVSCVLVVYIFTFIYNYMSIDSNAYLNICTVCIYMYICTCIPCMYIHIHIYCTYAYVDKYVYTYIHMYR